jgi:hypothetical protein
VVSLWVSYLLAASRSVKYEAGYEQTICAPVLFHEAAAFQQTHLRLFFIVLSIVNHNSPSCFLPFFDMDLVFKLAKQEEEGVEDVTVDEWRQSGVSLFGVCSLFSKRKRPPPRLLISTSNGKGVGGVLPPKVDSSPATELPHSTSTSGSLCPMLPSSPSSVQYSAIIMVHPASFSSLDLLLDVNDMQVPAL